MKFLYFAISLLTISTVQDGTEASVQMPRVNGEPVVCLTRNGDAYQNVDVSTSTVFKSVGVFAGGVRARFAKQIGSTTKITFTAQNVEYVGHQIADYNEVKTEFPTCTDTTYLAGYRCFSFTIYEDGTLVELVASKPYESLLTPIGYARSDSSGYHISEDHGDQQYLFT